MRSGLWGPEKCDDVVTGSDFGGQVTQLAEIFVYLAAQLLTAVVLV